ncbi:MAG: HD domain-containing protein [Betaproteobacteria bacterium]|nr:HD domain-containing protein [Betaproteobacteria bacterium]
MSDKLVSMNERADALEMQQIDAMEKRIVTRSMLYCLAAGEDSMGPPIQYGPGAHLQMGEDPRLKPMPDRPTLLDYFRLRLSPGRGFQHLLQSANLAQKNGMSEAVVFACLLHDISIVGFIRSDHGYWGAQMIEPYVAEEVSWAIRAHQALRFYPDESVGYGYPDMYVRMFGEGYRPDAYIESAYREAKRHKWYMTARMVCVNDLYSFDPNVHVELEQFEDVIGRNFRQPREGLGNDNSPASHMWRTLRRPSNAL